MSFEKVKENINLVLKCRRIALDKIFRLQSLSNKDNDILTQKIERVIILASSSRGGTAVTSQLLQWQGANCSGPRGRLLTLPGEEKPHLIMAGLAFPTRQKHFDDLGEADATVDNVSVLIEELRSEVGYPMDRCIDLELYATQLYRRLLLQWPISFMDLQVQDALAILTKELNATFPNGYDDNIENRKKALEACIRCFNFIHPDFYDCWDIHDEENVGRLAGDCWSIEETPFVFPPPWHNAEVADLERGNLLLRDPSNAWRLSFWRTVFKKQSMEILHLVRDPRESIQGLCDGWNYPLGFQTMPVHTLLDIPGYTNSSNHNDSGWKFQRLNFSICEALSKKLFGEKLKLSLVEICAFQWKDAHEIILQDCDKLGLSRSVFYFSDLRHNTEHTFRKICISFQLELSKSGIMFARSFNDHWVMITPLAKHNGQDRWRNSPFSDEIKKLASSGYFDTLLMELGLDSILSKESISYSSELLNV